MGMSIKYTENSKDTLSAFLNSIVQESDETADNMLKEAGQLLKEYVVANLNQHRRSIAVRYKGRPAMADDVKMTRSSSRSSGKFVKVQGGKQTGTLWHIVNDGNLHSVGIHFMDGALSRLDGNIDRLWAKMME